LTGAAKPIHVESIRAGCLEISFNNRLAFVDMFGVCARPVPTRRKPAQIQIHGVINRRSIVGFEARPDPVRMSSHFAEGSLFDPRFNLEAAGDRLVLRDILASFERSLIVAALLAAGGNQRRAAKALGVLPTTLQEKLKRFGLLDERFGRRARHGGRADRPSDQETPRHEAGNTPKEDRPQ